MEMVIFAALLGLIPAFIAKKKGRNPILWWLFGVLLLIVALPAALLLKPLDPAQQQAGSDLPAQSSYTKSRNADEVAFEVIPAEAPVPFATKMLGMGSLAKNTKLSSTHRVRSSFTVSKAGIKLGSKFLLREDIHRIVVRNFIDENDTGLVSYSESSAVKVGMLLRASADRDLRSLSHRVVAESGGVPHNLCGGVSEEVAYAVMSDVSGVLGFTNNA